MLVFQIHLFCTSLLIHVRAPTIYLGAIEQDERDAIVATRRLFMSDNTIAQSEISQFAKTWMPVLSVLGGRSCP
jgi:hypothetical protein